MSVLVVALLVVAAERVAELWLARRNTRILLARGGVEHGRGQYPYFVLLHAAWLAALLVLVPWDTPPSWTFLGLFAVVQAGRFWVLWSLGGYFTTRIVTLPGAPLVRRGPYRFMRHPNYLVVVAEIALLPLAFRAYAIAIVFSILNLGLLSWRIRVEDRVLAPRRRLAG